MRACFDTARYYASALWYTDAIGVLVPVSKKKRKKKETKETISAASVSLWEWLTHCDGTSLGNSTQCERAPKSVRRDESVVHGLAFRCFAFKLNPGRSKTHDAGTENSARSPSRNSSLLAEITDPPRSVNSRLAKWEKPRRERGVFTHYSPIRGR